MFTITAHNVLSCKSYKQPMDGDGQLAYSRQLVGDFGDFDT